MTLFCVGDTDQLLYRFQGAKPELLTGELEQWLPNIETIKLETNYRSHQEERIDGYDVVYRYHGRKYATRTPFDPGNKLKIRVDVRPAD